MANQPAIHVEGLKELRQAIKRVGDKELGKALQRANKHAAERVSEAARPDVPVGATGMLRQSVRPLASQASGRVVAGKAGAVAYAAAIHFGVGPRPGKRGPHNIPARPFLFDAAERADRDIADDYAREIDRILDIIRKA